jgi:hypothetical protein
VGDVFVLLGGVRGKVAQRRLADMVGRTRPGRQCGLGRCGVEGERDDNVMPGGAGQKTHGGHAADQDRMAPETLTVLPLIDDGGQVPNGQPPLCHTLTDSSIKRPYQVRDQPPKYCTLLKSPAPDHAHDPDKRAMRLPESLLSGHARVLALPGKITSTGVRQNTVQGWPVISVALRLAYVENLLRQQLDLAAADVARYSPCREHLRRWAFTVRRDSPGHQNPPICTRAAVVRVLDLGVALSGRGAHTPPCASSPEHPATTRSNGAIH